MPQLHEQTFNQKLAEALRETTAVWRQFSDNIEMIAPEFRRQKRRCDLMIDAHRRAMRPVIIECAYGGDNDKDAAGRLTQDEFTDVDTVIALAIPLTFQELTDRQCLDQLRQPNCRLRYASLQRRDDNDKGATDGVFRFPSSGYCQGNVADLAAFVRMSAASRATISRTANKATSHLARAAEILGGGFSPSAIHDITARVGQRSSLGAIRTVTLLWMDAMLVQSYLRNRDFLPLRDIPNPTPDGHHNPADLIEAWQRVLNANWHSIFEPAIEALKMASGYNSRVTKDALFCITEACMEIAQSRIGDGFNVGGELFPKIAPDRKTAAAFYTTSASAEFLAGLTIRESDREDWGDFDIFKRLKVADLACGTGTLLRHAYRRVRLLGEARGWNIDEVGKVHIDAMQGGLIGTDVSPIAAHLTNSGLTLSGGALPYSHTQIGWVEAGRPVSVGNGLSTGSLEFLTSATISNALMGEDTSGEMSGIDTGRAITVGDASIDYIVMNPPYSRTRGGQSAFDIAGMDETQRQECQARWGQLIRQIPANKTAGMAASFLCLASQKIKDGGRIGFVLPFSFAFDKSWGKTRAMIVEDFEDILAISSTGLRDSDSFSADTGMGEMLLVATRRKRNGTRHEAAEVRCVNLYRAPNRQGEAGESARAILAHLDDMPGETKPILIGDEELGQIIRFQPTQSYDPWLALGSLQDAISLDVKGIATDGALMGVPFRCQMTTLGQLFKVGPTHDLIGHPRGGDGRGAFQWTNLQAVNDRLRYLALWAANARDQRQILCKATHRGEVRDRAKMEKVLLSRGHLHYARGMRWTSQAILAAVTKREVFGGRAWTSLLHESEAVRSAFALWANSTMGLMVHWSRGSRTQEGRAGTQVQAIKDMPCPNFLTLPKNVLNAAIPALTSISQRPMLPACRAHEDPVREQIDEEVVTLLAHDEDAARAMLRELKDIRLAWCREPSVHGYNHTAMQALETNSSSSNS